MSEPGAAEGFGHDRRSADAFYLLLFRSNPQPMFVYDEATLEILDVNDAALSQYGYSREEFLRLSIDGLRPAEDVPRLLTHLQGERPPFSPKDEWRHRKKDGSVIYVDVSAHRSTFGGRDVRLVMATDVSERKRAEESLRRSEARYRALAANIPDCDLYLFDKTGRFVLADGTEMVRLGLSKEEIVGKTPRELFSARTAAKFERLFAETLAGRETEVEMRFRDQHYSIRTVPITDRGNLYAGMGLFQNITARKEQEARLSRLAAFRSELMDFLDESLRQGWDGDFYSRLLERAVRLIPGVEAGSLLVRSEAGHYGFAATVGFDLAGLAQVSLAAHELYCDASVLEPQIVLEPPDRSIDAARLDVLRRYGRLEDIRASIVVPIVHEGQAVAFLSLNSFSAGRPLDQEALAMARAFAQPVAVLFQRQALEARLLGRQRELERLANHDPLTGLPNRAHFYERLAEAIKQAERSEGTVALIYLDLDGFKRVNDSLGHSAGDRLLVAVAKRLRRCVRKNDTVARLGGDEFVFVLTGLKRPGDAKRVADKALAQLARPFRLGGQSLTVTPSIGVAVFPGDAGDAQTLIGHADTAMYRAKKAGHNRVCFFASS